MTKHIGSTAQPGKVTAMPEFRNIASWRRQFRRQLAHRFFLRIHMSLILGVTGVGGFVSNRLLLRCGTTSMAWRYAVSVVAAYGIFLICVRLWLAYMARRPTALSRAGEQDGIADAISRSGDGLFHLGQPAISSTAENAASGHAEIGNAASGAFWGDAPPDAAATVSTGNAAAGTFWGEGEMSVDVSSGAGDLAKEVPGTEFNAAAAMFLNAPADSAVEESGAAAGSAWGDLPDIGGDWDLDLGGDAPGAILAIVALAIVALVVFGAGAYLLYEAPAILAEAAFQVVLTWSVKRSAGRMNETAWVGAVAKGTAIPFGVVLLIATSVGVCVQAHYPQIQTLGELLR